MNTTNDITAPNDISQVEAWLTAAGFSYTVVDECPDRSCEMCQPAPISAAA